MSDPRALSDDISALWGIADDDILARSRPPAARSRQPEPEPERGPEPRTEPETPEPTQKAAEPVPAAPEAPQVDVDRLQAVEDRFNRLAAFTKAFCNALEAKVVDELGRVRSDMAAATETAVARLEATLTDRLDELAHEMATAPRTSTVVAQMIGPEADRVDDLERQLHEGLTRVHRTIQTVYAQGPGKPDVDGQTRLEAHVDERLDAVARQVAEAAGDSERLKALEEQVEEDVARLTAAIEAQQARFVSRADMQPQWEALKTAVAKGLTMVRANAEAAADASLASARADLDVQLRVLREQVAELYDVVSALQLDGAGRPRRPVG